MTAAAQPLIERSLTAELLVDSAVPQPPAISPDGRWVAYLVTTVGTREHKLSELWVAPADASSPPARLTGGTAWVSLPRWASDSASLFFWSGGQLHRIGPGGGDSEALAGWRGEVADHLPLAGGQSLALIAGDEPAEEDRRRAAERDDAIIWTERAPGAGSGSSTSAAAKRPSWTRSPAWHVVAVAQRPDGGPLAVISWACPDDEPGAFTARLHVADLETGDVRDLGPAGLDARSPAWWSDGVRWHVAYLAVTRPARSAAPPSSTPPCPPKAPPQPSIAT